MNLHEKYMTRCLELAKNGLGLVYPNPMVGSVLVCEGKIIGEGWHQKAGGPHAEVRAIASVKNKKLLSEATLYVNLEPCSHFGKTPPCADLIIKYGIRKVVIGTVDSNEEVGGKGIERLRDNGVEVVVPVLEKACRELNRRFFTYHEKNRPYIILKWAQTKDKFIFPDDKSLNNGQPFWISNAYSRQRVHQWRAHEEAIMVGKITAQKDNPKLNVRDFVGNNITRIAIDRNLELLETLHLLDGSFETIIFNDLKDEQIGNLSFVKLDFSKMIVSQMMAFLYRKGIQSLIVEGGSFTLNSFIQSDNWDEARIFEGNQHWNKGIKAPEIHGEQLYEEHIENDVLKVYKNN